MYHSCLIEKLKKEDEKTVHLGIIRYHQGSSDFGIVWYSVSQSGSAGLVQGFCQI
jgi:hypothetical protein